ncbi:MAG: hypothetical protein IKJ43_00710 [Bacilli bacterium]|nr:hypothetical protein [Bacilli bacterium]
MFKIDRKKIVSLVSGLALATSLGFYGCNFNKIHNKSNSMEYISADNADSTCVYFKDGDAILIPIDYASCQNGVVRIDFINDKDFRNLSISTKDSIIVYGDDNSSSYDRAFNVALGLLPDGGSVYNYYDILNGNYNSLDISSPKESNTCDNFISTENANSMCIYLKNGKAILIPIDHATYGDDVLRIDFNKEKSFKSLIVSDEDAMIVYSDVNSNSYDKAYNIASVLSECEIYNYYDLMNGNYYSLSTYQKVNKL